jgi:hypothetical protein
LDSLIGALPVESATARVLDPDKTGVGWTLTTELIALACELIDTNTRLHFDMNKGKGQKSPKPLHIQRPWKKRTKRRATSRETRAMFGGPVVVPSPKE